MSKYTLLIYYFNFFLNKLLDKKIKLRYRDFNPFPLGSNQRYSKYNKIKM